MTTINRTDYIQQLKRAFKAHPIVAILGPRQCGKTTLAQQFSKQQKLEIHHFDLENPEDLVRLESPMITFGKLNGLIIIDEIQRRPDLFPVLRVLADQKPLRKKFLILGSASRDLLKQSSESLAGRIQYLELTPFSYPEVDHLDRLWLRGGFPNSYLANSLLMSSQWRNTYITTFLEQDIPNLGIQIPPRTLRRFWMMLAHYHANIFNASEMGGSLGIAHTIARHYLDILSGTFMVRELSPWIENIDKRQIKSPKIYFRDSGLYHNLIGITDEKSLHHHPKLGASWEGMALEEIIRYHAATPQESYFWGVHNQAELDLFILQNGKRLGFEFKFSDAPRLTNSMSVAYETLNLDKLTVIYPGKNSYDLAKNIAVIGLEKYLNSV